VVHINAAVAGLVGAYMVGKRIGYGKEAMAPHSLTLTMVGASLLWVGWFGFNAGSAWKPTASPPRPSSTPSSPPPRPCWPGAAGEALMQGQGLDAGRCVRRRGRPGGDHAGGRQRRHRRRAGDRR
jgi:Amt family ammonium transporter